MTSIAGLRVLLVEDDEDSRELMALVLEGDAAKVQVAASAAEARSALHHGLPDVILTDIALPDEDGFRFVRALRADPRTQAIPAIALTGFADAAWRQRALDAGFQALLTKPCDILSLVAAIASLAPARRTPGDDAAEAAISSP